ncbi:DUF6538 domain-containing protein [Bosea sp. (in: a-proteobacteria)]|jgi:hypothetical protein|uniref:DUF6538 domain-containing protein n=1 Tax=Bosea sp. (in: a-proteobacteria) TaxID=1871050 RepID=UPI002DDD85A4|nr:DUF6538 domain-containing protein [Bosea sp. (in: a-proteobacteria)]HEV2508996.1 DUF6538 domain-containing protein [Bosea sp. (in: a-proteobacteria)]
MATPSRPPQTGAFYLRARVPRGVLGRVGRDIEKASLRTKDPARARHAFTQKLAQLQARWDEIRKGAQTLTHRQIEALAGEVYRAFRAGLP